MPSRAVASQPTATRTPYLVARSPNVDGLADLPVELILEVVDAAVLDEVVRDHSVGHEVSHPDALHAASLFA